MWPSEKPVPIAENVKDLPPYIFHILKGWADEYTKKGIKIDKLSIGTPDQHAPGFVVDAMVDAIRSGQHDGYPAFDGNASFKEAVIVWMKERFGVSLQPKHVLLLIGSKEGLGNFPRAVANVGDNILIPDPGYPAYQTSLKIAGVASNFFRLLPENKFIPDTDRIKKQINSKTRAVYLNYPNNPTGKCLTRSEFKSLIEFFLSNGVAVVSDHPYSELYRSDPPPVSALELCDFEREPVVEFFSLSKMMNMCGWRIGFAVGHEKIVAALRTVKTHMDTGQSGAIQKAAEKALTDSKQRETFLASLRKLYDERFKVCESALTQGGFEFAKPEGTFYLWIKTPKGMNDIEWTRQLLDRQHVLVTPGSAFGPQSTDHFRITGTEDKAVLKELIGRFPKAL